MWETENTAATYTSDRQSHKKWSGPNLPRKRTILFLKLLFWNAHLLQAIKFVQWFGADSLWKDSVFSFLESWEQRGQRRRRQQRRQWSPIHTGPEHANSHANHLMFIPWSANTPIHDIRFHLPTRSLWSGPNASKQWLKRLAMAACWVSDPTSQMISPARPAMFGTNSHWAYLSPYQSLLGPEFKLPFTAFPAIASEHLNFGSWNPEGRKSH